MAQDQENAQAGEEQAQQPAFAIEKIYVKDVSLEIPNAPQVFLQRETPEVGIELHNAAAAIGEAWSKPWSRLPLPTSSRTRTGSRR